ncbi:MAG: thioredoxin [Nitrospirae bacterium]|nr:MAG: thioredoxin [Nitrospirota bacterium]
MSGIVEDVSDDNYETIIHAPASLVVYGIASCEPCQAYDPVLETIAKTHTHIRVGKAKMHVPGRCREIKKRHCFETYPTTHFFSHGQLLAAREGKIEATELAALISRYFPSP